MPPNPGSDEAVALGCTCPVLDNGHGNERLGRERGFVINAECPLHGDVKSEARENRILTDEDVQHILSSAVTMAKEFEGE